MANGHEVPENVLMKIQKLLALSTSSNENEAALAAAKAQELMFRYELATADVNGIEIDVEPVQKSDKVTINEGHRGVNWKMDVMGALVNTSFCKWVVGWYTPRPNFTKTTATIIGRPHDIDVVKYTFNYLVAELERLATAYTAAYVGPWHKITVRNSWLMGASAGVSSRLFTEFRERQSESEQSKALVINKQAAVSEFYNKTYGTNLGSYSSQEGATARSAFNAGYNTGKQLGTARAIGDGSATKRIGGGNG
jgi:hypothetical protein